jgi:hypothetical protein
MEKYCVLMIDIVNSRGLIEERRFEVQRKLDKIAEIVNFLYKKNIVKPLHFSGGDSMQGVFTKISTAYEAYLLIKSGIFPYQIRAGIGEGKINQFMFNFERFEDSDSNVFDGSAYHLSKEAVETSRVKKNNITIKTNHKYDCIINTFIEDGALTRMTEARMTIYSLINLIEPITLNEDFDINSLWYASNISPLVQEIVNYYKETSEKMDNKEMICINAVERKLREYYKYEYVFISKDINRFNEIGTDLRNVLVDFIGFKDQNLNEIIKKGKLVDFRKREVAKVGLLEYFYKEH